MKNRILFLLFVAALAASGSLSPVKLQTNSSLNKSSSSFEGLSYDSLWKKAGSFEDQALPQSALTIVNHIYIKALNEQKTDQLIKASLYQIKLRSEFEENYLIHCINDREAALTNTPEPALQISLSILAELYWNYYQQNQYKILGRSLTAKSLSNDPENWTSADFVFKVSNLYTRSLSQPGILRQIPLDEIDSVLIQAKGSKNLRPTLYDFLVNRAIDFYNNNEASLTKPIDAFSLNDSTYLKPAGDFSGINPVTTDTTSFSFQALQLYADATRFHLNDSNPAPLIDLTLRRLNFVRNNSSLIEKDSLFLHTLLSMQKTYQGKAAVAEIMAEIAAFWYADENPGIFYNGPGPKPKSPNYTKAHNWCLRTIELYPESNAAARCKTMLQSIREKSLSITVAGAVSPNRPFPALIKYRNSKHVYFRLLKPDYNKDAGLMEQLYSERGIEKYLTFKPVNAWNIDLPQINDYREHSIEAIIPGIATGYYVLLISSDPAFSLDQGPMSAVDFWSTDISYLSVRNTEGSGSFFVRHRETGEAMAGVKVQTYTSEFDYTTRRYIKRNQGSYITGADGSFTIAKAGRSYLSLSFDFKSNNDRVVAENYFSVYPDVQPDRKEQIRTWIFTDRSIYRPGQTIYYKGIVTTTSGDSTSINTNYKGKISLFDINGRKLDEETAATNRFGSFSGSFVLPASGPTGSYTLNTANGSQTILVEAYKRPAFEVNFTPPSGSYVLGQATSLTATAKSYSGVAVTGAQVSYRVVRSASYPMRTFAGYGWWPQRLPEAEIANGTLKTGADGSFTVDFTAKPDPTSSSSDAVYTYTVYADVTDINGETHQASASIQVSRISMLIDLDLPANLDLSRSSPFKIKTTNLAGTAVAASVTIEAFRLKQEERLLRPRHWGAPDTTLYTRDEFISQLPTDIFYSDDLQLPVKDKKVFEGIISTKADSLLNIPNLPKWEPGSYLITATATDAYGKTVKTERKITVYNPALRKAPLNQVFWAQMLSADAVAGSEISLLAGTAANRLEVLLDIRLNGTVIEQQWITLKKGQRKLVFGVPKDFSGALNVSLTGIYNNRSYYFSNSLFVEDKARDLQLVFETFRSKIKPGEPEKWTLKLTDTQKQPVKAEVLAGMYDASLDAFAPNFWNFGPYGKSYSSPEWEFNNAFDITNGFSAPQILTDYTFGGFQEYDQLNWFGYSSFGGGFYRGMRKGGVLQLAEMQDQIVADKKETPAVSETATQNESASKPQAKPEIRSNLNETAFFMPDLVTDAQGGLSIAFTAPQSLTRWNLNLLAHTSDLRYSLIRKSVITQKELMVTPNLPRFLREGDQMVLQARISNLTDNPMQGIVRLELFDAITMNPVDSAFSNSNPTMEFQAESGANAVASFKIKVPQNIGALAVRISAVAGNFSDGEESMLPVLTNRVLVTETMPLPMQGNQTKTFRFEPLLNQSKTAVNHKLTLEYTSNPAWYGIQSLPYLSEQTTENSDQVFNRLYANSLAMFIANSKPSVKQVVDLWKSQTPDAFWSQLEKNQELKSVVLEETPWLLDAASESEQKRRIAQLFDLPELERQQRDNLLRLQQAQTTNGGWPWFEGMPESRYITQLIVTGIGRLHYLDVLPFKKDDNRKAMLQQAINFLAGNLADDYRQLQKQKQDDPKTCHISAAQIQFLYSMSYLGQSFTTPQSAREAVAFYSDQARSFWKQQDKMSQAMIAIWAGRNGDAKTMNAIVRSLRERSVTNPETGTYWAENGVGYSWYRVPVETQAVMIELFEEFGNDPAFTDGLKTWLLKQKQTQFWPGTRATADAIYALLLRGSDWLQSGKPASISLGNHIVSGNHATNLIPEAGTGYLKTSWNGIAIRPDMGNISITTSNNAPSWGAIYLQYFEDADKVTAQGSPLQISKTYMVRRLSAQGYVYEPVGSLTPIVPGDQIMVHITLHSDRNLEFVHMKDLRASGLEPVNVLSGYRWKDGIGFYESTRDVSSDFYFDYLPKGAWVFEYPLVAAQSGDFTNGPASVQCLYAPEFAAHSAGTRIMVQ